ncbi:MAG: hypothetical protein ABI995_08680, partial [Acidobacteriota bacterium]
SKASPVAKTGTVGLILATIAGLFYGLFFPTLDQAVTGDNALSAYGAVLLVAVGIFGSSIVIVPFFLNFPVQGAPLELRRYFKMPLMQHVWGVGSGIVWAIGLWAGLLDLGLPAAIQPTPVVTYMLTHAAPLVAALWGILVWREFAGSVTRVNMMLAAMFVLLLAGLGLIAAAPTFGS